MRGLSQTRPDVRVTDEVPDVRDPAAGLRARVSRGDKAGRRGGFPISLQKSAGSLSAPASGATRGGWVCVLGQQPGGQGLQRRALLR